MKILIVFDKIIPAPKYGGIERAIWWLGKELVRQGHKVTYLVGKGSECPFANVKIYDPEKDIDDQIPDNIDVVHCNISPKHPLKKPYLFHLESNYIMDDYDINTVFVSRNHAKRHHAECFVYNGLDPDDYGDPDLDGPRNYLHFLAKAAWRVKNVKGAISIARKSRVKLEVMGGNRLNIKMGFRFTLNPRVKFHGMIGGEPKNRVIRGSAGLIFPVVWNEPFGIAIIESMYFGCPVFGTPYGAIPEIVDKESGYLSSNLNNLVEAVRERETYNKRRIHEQVMDLFSVSQMTNSFLDLYERILNGENLNADKPYFERGSEPKFLPFSQ